MHNLCITKLILILKYKRLVCEHNNYGREAPTGGVPCWDRQAK